MGVVSGSIELNVNLQDVVSSGYVNPVTFPAQLQSPAIPGMKLNYTSGTGALQLDGLYFKPITLTGTQTLDLSALTGIGGESITANRAREVILYNPDATSGHDVKLYQGASNPWAPAPTSANPLIARAGGGMARISDPNGAGAGVGNVITGASKTIILDTGANAITFYLLIGTSSVA